MKNKFPSLYCIMLGAMGMLVSIFLTGMWHDMENAHLLAEWAIGFLLLGIYLDK